MTVMEVGRNAITNVIDVFAASFVLDDIDCNPSAGPAMSGEIRWNSTVGYKAAGTNPPKLDLGTVDIGATGPPMNVTITSTGSDPTTFGAATLGGPTPSAFVVDTNGCQGMTLAYGQTCTVSVRGTPTASGEHIGHLIIADDTVSAKKVVGLSVDGTTGATGTYYPLSPARLLDTRFGNGAPKAKVGPGRTISVLINGRGGVPATGVSAVVLNVTVTEPTTSGYVTVWPSLVARPNASSLNFTAGLTRANSVTVPVGTNGRVSFFNSTGFTHLIADVVGFYASNNDVLPTLGLGGQLFPHEPTRLLDTRIDFGPTFKLPANFDFLLGFSYVDPTINPHVRAVVANITAVSPDGVGFIQTWNGNGSAPNASTLNFRPGHVVPNLAIIPVRLCGSGVCPYDDPNLVVFGIRTSKATHLIVDVVGFMDDSTLLGGEGLRFDPNTPTRIADSRINFGTTKLGPGSTRTITAPPPVADESTIALAMNVTAVLPTANTFMTVWEASTPRPFTSNLNPSKLDVVPNAVITTVNLSNQFSVFNQAGSVNVVVDVVGTFFFWSGAAAFAESIHGAAAMTQAPDHLAPTPMVKPPRLG